MAQQPNYYWSLSFEVAQHPKSTETWVQNPSKCSKHLNIPPDKAKCSIFPLFSQFFASHFYISPRIYLLLTFLIQINLLGGCIYAMAHPWPLSGHRNSLLSPLHLKSPSLDWWLCDKDHNWPTCCLFLSKFGRGLVTCNGRGQFACHRGVVGSLCPIFATWPWDVQRQRSVCLGLLILTCGCGFF